MSITIPDYQNYTLNMENQYLIQQTFNYYTSQNDDSLLKLLNQVLGFPVDNPTTDPTKPPTVYKSTSMLELLDIDLLRVQRFYLFWNQSNYDFGENLSFLRMSASDIDTSSTNSTTPVASGINDVIQKNAAVTCLLVLVFKSILSSPDSINTSTPLDVFTSPSDKEDFSLAVINILNFVGTLQGLGNLPIVSTSTDQLTLIKTYWNKGFIYQYCKNKYLQSCSKSKGFSSPSELNLSSPNDEQDCVQNYRTKLSQTPIALSWCGCFSPLPSFMLGQTKDKDVKTPNFSYLNIPNVCDYLCFKESVEERISSNGQNNTETTGVMPYFNSPFAQNNPSDTLRCTNSTICVIDQNNVDSENSTVDINFNQICKCTEGQPCLCFIDTSTSGVLDNVSNGNKGMINQANFNQRCSGSFCYKIQSDGSYQATECNKINTASTGEVFSKNSNGLSESKDYKKIYSNFWYSLLFVVGVFIIFIFSYFEVSTKLK